MYLRRLIRIIQCSYIAIKDVLVFQKFFVQIQTRLTFYKSNSHKNGERRLFEWDRFTGPNLYSDTYNIQYKFTYDVVAISLASFQ